MNKKLMIGIIVAVVVVASAAVGIGRSGAQTRAYEGSLQPLLQRCAVLDSDIHRIVSSQTTISAQKQQISTAENDARELRGALASIVPPNRYGDGHEALISAASARLTILDQFGNFLDHMMLINSDEIGDSIDKIDYYLNMAVLTGSRSYADSAKREITKLRGLLDDNKKWIAYAEEDLSACQKAVEEYVLAVQIANRQLRIGVTSKIGDIDLGSFRRLMAEARELNDGLIDLSKELSARLGDAG